MLKLELEKLLEAGFYALEVEFGRRIYGEEFITGATVDDAIEPISREDMEKSLKPYPETMDDLIEESLKLRELSGSQGLGYHGKPPFFVRQSVVHNEFYIIYTAESTEEVNSYEKEADRLIREGKILEEMIIIRTTDPEGPMACFICSRFPKPPTVTSRADSINGLDPLKMEKLVGLNGTPYNPQEVYQAIMDFMR